MSLSVQHQTDRLVLWLHRPLDVVDEHWKYDKRKNPIAHFARASHHALFVGPPGLTAEQVTDHTQFTRYELLRNKTTNAVRLNPDYAARRVGWKGVGLFNFGIDPSIAGVTSLSDGAIKIIADDLIENHGVYDVLVNSCQNFASSLYLAICDVKDSARAKIIQFAQKADQKSFQGKDWKRTLLKEAVPAVAVLTVFGAAVAYEKWQENCEDGDED